MRDNPLTTEQPLKHDLNHELKVNTYTKQFRGNIITYIAIGSKNMGKFAYDYLKGFAHFRLLMGLTLVVSTFISLINLLLDIAGGSSNWHLAQEAFIASALLISAVYWLFTETEEQQKAETDITTTVSTSSVSQPITETSTHPILTKNRDTVNITEKMQQLISESSNHQSDDRLNLKAQFKQWRFTPSETEIAYLLLKGLSFDEISTIRQTKQKTVRQQATSIYRKAEVNGRHEFAAWFIEDLF